MNIPKAGKRELPEAGAHNGVCVQLIDLGTQQVTFQGNIKNVRKLLMGFELVDIENEDGSPTLVSNQFTFSDSTKGNLFKTLKQWQAVKHIENFDMDDCLGKPAIVTIVHNESDKGTFANISNIGALTKGTKVRKPQSGLVSLYLDDSFDHEVFEALPEWIRTKIASSPEYETDVPAKPAPKKPSGKDVPAKKGGKR